MKALKILFMLFALLLAFPFIAWADGQRLVVWQKSGEKVYFDLNEEPETTSHICIASSIPSPSCPTPWPCSAANTKSCPLLEVFGYDVPVWEAASIVTSSPVVQVTSRTQTARTKKYTEGTFVLQGLMMDDQVEFELVTDSTLVQRGSCRWDDTLLDSYPHVISESTEAWEGCGGKVEIEEESVGGAEQTLGPEQMGSRTYKYHSDLLWYTRYTGSFKKNSDGAWNTDRYTTDSEGNMKGKSGSYSYVAAQEVNVYRAKITRGNQVRYGPRIQFVGSQKYNTFNGSE